MTKRTKIILLILFLLMVGISLVILYSYYLSKIPDCILLRSRESQEINYEVPVKGELYYQAIETTATDSIDFSHPFIVTTGGSEQYYARLKLFGILPYKDVEILVSDEISLVPCGRTVGLYMETEGVLVIDLGSFQSDTGEQVAPAMEGLRIGDYILAVNGKKIEDKKDFIRSIGTSNGEVMELLVKRREDFITVELEPVLNEEGEYKLGIWVRDSTQGIGTITYYDAQGNFGALGHGVTDVDLGELMDIYCGNIYATKIMEVKRGTYGEPGEVTGMIHYVQSQILGSIYENTGCGIHGRLCENANQMYAQDKYSSPLPIGYKSEVFPGEASILSDVDGTVKEYKIQIVSVNMNSNDHRSLLIKVTDPNLINYTGGIIQGMSGSPILQDGKIIGAVTHVFVNDPTRGYGIFIEEMLGE